jgi:hypothetical protein
LGDRSGRVVMCVLALIDAHSSGIQTHQADDAA